MLDIVSSGGPHRGDDLVHEISRRLRQGDSATAENAMRSQGRSMASRAGASKTARDRDRRPAIRSSVPLGAPLRAGSARYGFGDVLVVWLLVVVVLDVAGAPADATESAAAVDESAGAPLASVAVVVLVVVVSEDVAVVVSAFFWQAPSPHARLTATTTARIARSVIGHP